MHADDSVFSLAHKSIDFLQKSSDQNLQKVDRWLKNNQLSVNVEKTKFLLFTKSSKTLDVLIKGSKTEQTKSIKYLGVLIDDKLKWHEHINFVSNKLSAANGILCKLRRYVLHSSVARGGGGGSSPRHWLVKYAKSHLFGGFEADFL